MTEDDEMLYREMNEEDDFYMGDRKSPSVSTRYASGPAYREVATGYASRPASREIPTEYAASEPAEEEQTVYSEPRDFSHVPVDPPANGSDAAVHGCLAIAVAAVLFVLAYLLL